MVTQTHSLPSLDSSPRAPSIAIPEEILNRYVSMAMRRATPTHLAGDQEGFYCALAEFSGVWADGASMKECLDTLEEVLRDWLILKLVDRDRDIPVIDDIDLTVISRRF